LKGGGGGGGTFTFKIFLKGFGKLKKGAKIKN